MDVVSHKPNLISVKTDNIKDFLFNKIKLLRISYKYLYLWVSHKEYNIEFNPEVLYHKRYFHKGENYIFEVIPDNNYMQVINEIADAYTEFQFWELCLTNNEIQELGNFSYPTTPGSSFKDGAILYKSIENDVVWIESNNATNIEELIL